MASIIRILHRTEYLYDQPVMLNPHRLMLRPRDGHDLWVDDAFVTITPRASLRWFFDTFGNSVAEATFGSRRAKKTDRRLPTRTARALISGDSSEFGWTYGRGC